LTDLLRGGFQMSAIFNLWEYDSQDSWTAETWLLIKTLKWNEWEMLLAFCAWDKERTLRVM
jgi:hypothetical protein